LQLQALVSGGFNGASDLRVALKGAGWDVIIIDDLSGLDATCRSLGPGSVDAYIQLPVDLDVGSDGPLERMHELLRRDVVERFSDATTVAPLLRRHARVVLVARRPLCADEVAIDDPDARRRLLQMLADAIETSAAERSVRAVVVDDVASHEIVGLAIAEATPPVPFASVNGGTLSAREAFSLADLGADLSYADWRHEVFSLAALDQPTYLG
jgi:hypothetical protein